MLARSMKRVEIPPTELSGAVQTAGIRARIRSEKLCLPVCPPFYGVYNTWREEHDAPTKWGDDRRGKKAG